MSTFGELQTLHERALADPGSPEAQAVIRDAEFWATWEDARVVLEELAGNIRRVMEAMCPAICRMVQTFNDLAEAAR